MKTILITGCSSGIGLYCAQALQQKGYSVIATARSQGDVSKLRSLGLESYLLDLRKSSQITAFVKTITKKYKRIDVLFNNAGFAVAGAIEDLKRSDLSDQFETNLFGAVELTNKIIPLMRKQRSGRIIWNSSLLGFVSMPFRGAYNASKYAMEGLVDAQRIELSGSGIFCSLIEPGPITSSFRANAYKQFHKRISAQKSVHRLTYSQMVARLQKRGKAMPFTLGPKAVCSKLISAIESKKPKSRYYVTFPTYLFAFLKIILPTSWLDAIFRKII